MAGHPHKIVVKRFPSNQITITMDGVEFPFAFISAKTKVAYKHGPSLVLEIACEHLTWDDSLLDKSPTA